MNLPASSTEPAKTKWWRRLLICAIAFLCLYFGLPSCLNWLAARLVTSDPLQPADIAVALGGGQACRRPHHAVQLYRQGLVKKIVLTGLNFSQDNGEENETRQYLRSLGVAEVDLLILKDVRNTRMEAAALARLMRERGWSSAAVVSDPYHVRRAHYTIQRAAPDLTFYAAPVPAGPGVWQPYRWWTRRGDVYLTVREFIAWANTLLGGLQ